MTPPRANVPVEHIIGITEAREMTGSKTRGSFIYKRLRMGFPQPITTVRGPGGTVELFDAREVRRWIANREQAKRGET